MEDDLERPVCSFCGVCAQSPVPQGWFSAELEHVLDEDEEIAAVEVWEAVACADCEGQIRTTAAHLVAQGWQPICEYEKDIVDACTFGTGIGESTR